MRPEVLSVDGQVMDYVLIDEEMLIETGGEKKVEFWQCTLPLPYPPHMTLSLILIRA